MNILCCGVGGQGIVLASKLLSRMAMSRGDKVLAAETIGMAQKGGSVVSHIRIGATDISPLIPIKGADTIMAFEPIEAVRMLPYLKDGGNMVVNTKVIKPAPSAGSSQINGQDYIDYLINSGIKVTLVHGDNIAKQVGSPKVNNIVILAYAIKNGAIDFTFDQLKECVTNSMRREFLPLNMKAIELVENS